MRRGESVEENEKEGISCMEAQGQFRVAVNFQGHTSFSWY